MFVSAGTINFLIAPHTKLTPPMADPALSYPVGDQQVPESLLFVLGYIVPALLILVISAVGEKLEFCVTLLSLSQSVSGAMLVTTIAKKIAGRPRPCFYAMFRPILHNPIPHVCHFTQK